MRLTFLSAAVPLTKSIALSPRTHEYTTTSYPMVTRMTSAEIAVADMADFAQQLNAYAQRGWCLMKGSLERPIVDESRAGLTVQTEDHEWVCFDFDKVECSPDVDGAVEAIYKYLPECVHDVDAVIQLSASCVHPQARMLSAHIFMRLSQPVDTKTLTNWLTAINFQGAARAEIRLSDSNMALSFPLDRTVASPAKLLYIAPPRTIGFTPELTDTIHFLPGDRRSFHLPHFTPVPFEEQRKRLNELRTEAGLPATEISTHEVGGMEFYKDPEEVVIHDVRVSASGHLRFNINGGDSLAYFIDLKKPNIIGNFKGEPFMRTEQVAPKFFETLKKTAPTALKAQQKLSDTTEVLAFYATNRGSAVHVGVYDRATDALRVDRSSTEAAYAWLAQHGAPMKSNLPHYDLTFDISSDIRYEEGYPVINLFARTEFLKLYGNIDRTQPLDTALDRFGQECPVFGKLLLSVCGGDKAVVKRFLNWVAYIFQTRKKASSAWLFHGTEGTGKGLMFTHLLVPLFGRDHCVQLMMKDIDGDFNSLLEGKLVVMIDEASMSKTRDPVEMMARLRNWITEPTMTVNQKHRVEETVQSFTNFIVGSNDRRPILINYGDRRWNVAPRQEDRLVVFPNEMAVLEQGEELPALAKLLGELQVNEDWLRNPDDNAAKMSLFESTHGVPDAIAAAIRAGNTDFFFAARPTPAQLQTGRALLPMTEYDDLLRAMLNNTLNVLTYNDLYVLFKVCLVDDKSFPENATAQRKLFKRLGFADFGTLHCKRTSRSSYGHKGPNWEQPSEEFAELARTLVPDNADGKVVSIR